MSTPFSEFINLIYIEGYFNKGAFRGKEFKAKPFFVLNLLKGSVKTPDIISFSKSAINGYIGGDSVASVVRDIKNAEYDKELLAQYIEGLYETKHTDSKTYNERYGDKLYKDALYEKVQEVYPKITIEGMTTHLVASFDKIIADIKYDESTTIPEISEEDIKATIIDSYSLSESEKKMLIKLCESIKNVFRSIKHQTDIICNKQNELKNLTHSEDDEKWKPHLENEINSLKRRFDESYPEIEKLCADMVVLLESKKGIHKSLETIISIAQNISSNEYKITCPGKFNYHSLSVMMSRFNDSYDKIRRDIDKL